MRKRDKYIVAISLAITSIAIINECVRSCHHEKAGKVIDSVSVTVVEKHDTVIISPEPNGDKEVIVRYIPVPTQKPSNKGEEPDTTASEKVDSLPITQKVYEDSLYTAWVSGYEANLDSIRVTEKVITTTTTITKEKEGSRWAIGPTIALGVTNEGRISPVLGIGVTYKFRWKKKDRK